MNYRWCKHCSNYLSALGCALRNEEFFEGDDYAAQHCSDRQECDEEDPVGDNHPHAVKEA